MEVHFIAHAKLEIVFSHASIPLLSNFYLLEHFKFLKSFIISKIIGINVEVAYIQSH